MLGEVVLRGDAMLSFVATRVTARNSKSSESSGLWMVEGLRDGKRAGRPRIWDATKKGDLGLDLAVISGEIDEGGFVELAVREEDGARDRNSNTVTRMMYSMTSKTIHRGMRSPRKMLNKTFKIFFKAFKDAFFDLESVARRRPC